MRSGRDARESESTFSDSLLHFAKELRWILFSEIDGVTACSHGFFLILGLLIFVRGAYHARGWLPTRVEFLTADGRMMPFCMYNSVGCREPIAEKLTSQVN